MSFFLIGFLAFFPPFLSFLFFLQDFFDGLVLSSSPPLSAGSASAADVVADASVLVSICPPVAVRIRIVRLNGFCAQGGDILKGYPEICVLNRSVCTCTGRWFSEIRPISPSMMSRKAFTSEGEIETGSLKTYLGRKR